MYDAGLPDRSVGLDHARFPFRFPSPSPPASPASSHLTAPRPTSSHTPRPTDAGTIPDCIGSDLISLTGLELDQNKLDGTIPQSLCLIGDSLTYLVLYDNDLTGECTSGC